MYMQNSRESIATVADTECQQPPGQVNGKVDGRARVDAEGHDDGVEHEDEGDWGDAPVRFGVVRIDDHQRAARQQTATDNLEVKAR